MFTGNAVVFTGAEEIFTHTGIVFAGAWLICTKAVFVFVGAGAIFTGAVKWTANYIQFIYLLNTFIR